MFFKTVTFQVFGLFCITRLTPRGSTFDLIPEKYSDSYEYNYVPISIFHQFKFFFKFLLLLLLLF
jgi:hypothetical protein